MNLIQLQPDDVLVLRCPHVLSREQQGNLRGTLQLVLGAGQRVVVLDAGQALDVIRVAISGKVETNEIVRPAGDEITYLDRDGKAVTKAQHDALLAEDSAQRAGSSANTSDETASIPPRVWLYRVMLTKRQMREPLHRGTNGQYAVAIGDLTDEQRAIPHVSLQLDQMFLDGKINRGAD